MVIVLSWYRHNLVYRMRVLINLYGASVDVIGAWPLVEPGAFFWLTGGLSDQYFWPISYLG